MFLKVLRKEEELKAVFLSHKTVKGFFYRKDEVPAPQSQQQSSCLTAQGLAYMESF